VTAPRSNMRRGTPSPAGSPSRRRASPYVGPRAFQREERDRLRGRDDEIEALVDQLIADRIVLLYSPSGAGKTSLIQAGLVPRLETHGFHALPVIRVGLRPPERLRLAAGANRYVVSAITALSGDRQQLPSTEVLSSSLHDYLTEVEKTIPTPRSLLLVFDQFEEILTLDPTDLDEKRGFFQQLGQALRARDRWALFAMREEFVTALDPYSSFVPTRFGSGYRLEPLGPEAASAAIREPAEAVGVEFDAGAARALVDNLRTVRVLRPEGAAQVPGPFVEPVQLQVVCQRVWERLEEGQRTIGPKDLEGISVDRALGDYYEDALREVVRASGMDERKLRLWIDRHLIVDRAIRGQVPAGADGLVGGLPMSVVQHFVAAFLVRADNRGGAVWYELSHDRLVRPVSESNTRWLLSNASPLQQQARCWNDAGRDEAYLLTGRALQDAERWLPGNESGLDEVDRQFLDASRRVALRQQRRRTGTVWGMVVLLFILLLVSVGSTIDARRGRREAQAALARAEQAMQQRDSARQQTRDSVDLYSKSLVAQFVVNESDTTDLAKVQQSLLANTAISRASRRDSATRGGTRIRYLSREVDEHRVRDALEKLGFQLERVASRAQSAPTNAVAFDSAGVPIEHVRLVVFALLRAGIEVKQIKPFVNTGTRTRMIEVYGDTRLTGPPLSVQQAMAYQGR
jgi:hypothetical protein